MRRLRPWCILLVALTAIGCGSARTPPETSPPPPEQAEPPSDPARRSAGRAAAPPPERAAPPVVESADTPSSVRTHTVQRGDTLSSLSRRYGVSVDDLVRANELADPDSLSIGDRLVVPERAAPATWLWPVAGGEILSRFGSDRGADVHRGLDIRARGGEPVLAAWPGVVVYAGGNMRDYGNAVILDHGGGLTSLYGHNSELLVRIGDEVERGDPIALAGRSGNATTVHCHFEVRKDAVALDPLEFLANAGR